MKTTFKDYLFSTLSISFISVISFFLSAVLFHCGRSFLKDFTPLIVFFFFILMYGLITSLLLKILRFFLPFIDGKFSMEHRQFTLWKLHAVLMQTGQPCLRLFIPIFLRPILYSLFGATMGKQTAVGGKILDPYLTVMEDQSVIGEDSVVAAHIMTDNKFILGKVIIRQKATVGIKAILMPGVEVGENSIVLPGAIVLVGTRIPPNEIWAGNPAVKIKENLMLLTL
jgi:hypothetical protein